MLRVLLFICNTTEVEQFILPRGIETVSCHWLKASLSSSICQLEFLLVFGDDPDQEAELLPNDFHVGHKIQSYYQKTTSLAWVGTGLNTKTDEKGNEKPAVSKLRTQSGGTQKRWKIFSEERLILAHKCLFLCSWRQCNKTCMQLNREEEASKQRSSSRFSPSCGALRGRKRARRRESISGRASCDCLLQILLFICQPASTLRSFSLKQSLISRKALLGHALQNRNTREKNRDGHRKKSIERTKGQRRRKTEMLYLNRSKQSSEGNKQWKRRKRHATFSKMFQQQVHSLSHSVTLSHASYFAQPRHLKQNGVSEDVLCHWLWKDLQISSPAQQGRCTLKKNVKKFAWICLTTTWGSNRLLVH